MKVGYVVPKLDDMYMSLRSYRGFANVTGIEKDLEMKMRVPLTVNVQT